MQPGGVVKGGPATSLAAVLQPTSPSPPRMFGGFGLRPVTPTPTPTPTQSLPAWQFSA